MITSEEKNIYTEVFIVLNNLSKEEYNKVPKEYINFLKSNINSSCEFKYDTSKPFKEQKISSGAKAILFGMFVKFAATTSQKERIIKYKCMYNAQKEKEKLKKYATTSLYNRNIYKNGTIQNDVREENQLIKYETSFLKKIISNFKKWLHL